MNLPREVAKTIQALDEKIRDLEDTKRRLIATFAEPVSTLEVSKNNGNSTVSPPPRLKSSISSAIAAPPDTQSSADKLLSFLRMYGPATRKEILESSGVPDGSISYLLRNNPSRYRQREDQKWEVIG